MKKYRTLKKIKRARKHGFLKRGKKRSGKNVLKKRRLKGRSRLSI
ncbi:MAG: 50S ribosomal protein L34 [Candidatus Levybacteria bacterium]|nr:50S ribosomal protein L34 [Candidatus Levybacteria bacterium]